MRACWCIYVPVVLKKEVPSHPYIYLNTIAAAWDVVQSTIASSPCHVGSRSSLIWLTKEPRRWMKSTIEAEHQEIVATSIVHIVSLLAVVTRIICFANTSAHHRRRRQRQLLRFRRKQLTGAVEPGAAALTTTPVMKRL